jgi:hypothetical protein
MTNTLLEDSSKNEKPDFVYSLHGIRTNAFWQSRLSEVIRQKTGFKIGYRNYLRFTSIMTLFKDVFLYKPLRLVEEDIRGLQTDFRVSVIAHSFGTWLLLRALRENSNLQVHHVILCGAVFQRSLSWWQQLRSLKQITGDIVNFCGTRDPIPALAELLSRDFGASGVVGAGDPSIRDSFHNCGHSGFLTTKFCQDYWIGILTSKPYETEPAPVKPAWYISPLLLAAAHRGALLLMILASIFALYRFFGSAWSCSIRPCYVDVVRVHNFSSSTRAAGERNYVDQITFEYTYNFDRDYLVFRAPKLRGPVVTSLIGPQLSPIKESTESRELLIVANKSDKSTIEEFKVPVRDRRAYFSVEFANDSSDSPDGVEVFADRTIRNLRLKILKPKDVTLVAPKEEFRKGVLIDGQPQDDAPHCEFASDGTEVRCTDLDLPRSHGFFYCFLAKGWNGPAQIPSVQTPGCKAIVQQK